MSDIAEETGKGNVVRSCDVSAPNLMLRMLTGIEMSSPLSLWTEELVVAEDPSFLQKILSSF